MIYINNLFSSLIMYKYSSSLRFKPNFCLEKKEIPKILFAKLFYLG